MGKIGILKYPGASGDHDLYWAVRYSCNQKPVILESGRWNPNEVSALLIPGGLFAPGYSDAKDGHLITYIIQNRKPVLTLAEGFFFVKKSQKLFCDLLPLKNKEEFHLGPSVIVDNQNIWLQEFQLNETVDWSVSFRFHSFSQDDAINSLVVSKGDHRILGIELKEFPIACFLVHPERAVDEILGDVSGKKVFKTLRKIDQ
ncbi:MAG: hypothetical protein PHE86_00700 [Candidatus Marinimicrobia bacterium]|nr:hypothetical protein [Candidatus Neomarinimicrobiota bacterium]